MHNNYYCFIPNPQNGCLFAAYCNSELIECKVHAKVECTVQDIALALKPQCAESTAGATVVSPHLE